MEKDLKELLIKLKNIDDEKRLEEPQNQQVLYLAYIGDTIFDLFTRDYILRNNISKYKMDDIHKMNTNLVCAKSQARIIEKLIDDNFLNDDEKDFYRHARNAHSNSKSRNSSIVDYRKATGFEALLGLLYYKDSDRLLEVLKNIESIIDK